MPDFDNYLSPFSWRYASQEMRQIWSESNKRLLWRKIWVALAETQLEFGLVTPLQLAELRQFFNRLNIPRSLQIENEIHHNLMAELKTFAEQCPAAGGIIHLGAPSSDIEDNMDVFRIHQALTLIISKLSKLLTLFSEKVNERADIPIIAVTHLQPAEPSTLGYRFTFYSQDLIFNLQELRRFQSQLKGKGFKSAVGTGAAYADQVGMHNLDQYKNQISLRLGLPFFTITNQTYPRKQDFMVTSSLAGLGVSLYKFAFDLRSSNLPQSENYQSLSASTRWALRLCHSNVTRSRPRKLTLWRAYSQPCRRLPGRMPHTPCLNEPWMTARTGGLFYQKHFLFAMSSY